jgi:hypothetical protein
MRWKNCTGARAREAFWRFASPRGISDTEEGGFFSHPCDEDLSPWTPGKENGKQQQWLPDTPTGEQLQALRLRKGR